ncbi:hypothetical protein ACFQH6_11780 [Halobacteriaceae archaeon GCM10025711]
MIGTAGFDSGPTAGPATAQTQPPPGVAPTLFHDVNGEVAVEDGEVTVRGNATGIDRVLVVVVDDRGQIATDLVSVDDDSFEEDVALVTRDGAPFSEGVVVGAVFSPGRDGVVGDGKIEGFTRADLAALDENTRRELGEQLANRTVTKTQAEVLELFYEESINDTGSDDRALVDVFTYTDARVAIDSVGPASRVNQTDIGNVSVGETMTVSGLTNRKPDDNTITVEVIDGPTPDAFDVAVTDTWGLDGVWTVELETDGVEPGAYTLEASDGDDFDRVAVRVLPVERTLRRRTRRPRARRTRRR